MASYTYNAASGQLIVGEPSRKNPLAVVNSLGLRNKLDGKGIDLRSDGLIVLHFKDSLTAQEQADLKAELDK